MLLVFINYYTITILSTVRAYIAGESEYSKGQKTALLGLMAYLETGRGEFYRNFEESIKIPMGDNKARHGLDADGDVRSISAGFIEGKNHPDDVGNMIWVYRTFKNNILKEPIRLWRDAEVEINELAAMGPEIRKEVETGKMTEAVRLATISKIVTVSRDLYDKESAFSMELSITARRINSMLLAIDIIGILLIAGSIIASMSVMMRRLHLSHKIAEEKNAELTETNKDLDTFIYSVSHDLRSPNTSLKGLIQLIQSDPDPENHKEYVALMDGVVEQQDAFIREILDFFRSKRSSVSCKPFSLHALVEDVIRANVFAPGAQKIAINKELKTDEVNSDELRVKMIINNLLSNAIKYSDNQKTDRVINISTEKVENDVVIAVEDNGIGLSNEQKERIFDLFYTGKKSSRDSSGLGLYILRQNVEKLHGRVELESELCVGSKFMVYIPCPQ